MTVLQRLRLLGILTSLKYASFILSSTCTSGLLLWAVRWLVVDLSLYSFEFSSADCGSCL